MLFPELEDKMKSFIDSIEVLSGILDDNVLLTKTQEFSRELDLVDFKNSKGWLQKFKERHGYQLRELCGENASADLSGDEGFLMSFQEKLHGYSLDNIFDINGAGLFYRPIPSKSVCKKARSGYKNLKERISAALCCNFSGKEKLSPLIIGKSKNLRCLKKIGLKNSMYDSSKRPWMIGSAFKTWLNGLNKKMKQEGQKILLLIDNYPAHKIDSEYSNVEVMFLPKNTTGILHH